MDIEEPGKNKKRRSRKKSSKMNSETNEQETGEQQPDNGGKGGGSGRGRGGNGVGRGGNGAGRGGNGAGRGGNGAGRGWNEAGRVGNGAGRGGNESGWTGNGKGGNNVGRGGNSDGRGGNNSGFGGRPQFCESNNGWRGGNNQFEYYMDPAIIQSRGLAVNNIGPGALLEGTLRINPKSYEDGFVCAPDSTSDIYIRGIRDRNRALQGDSVIIEVNPLNMWNVLNETIQDYLDTQGSEEDFKILLEGATINMKKERGEEAEGEEVDNKQPETKTKEAEVEAVKAEAASQPKSGSGHKSAKIPLEPETTAELVVAARSLAAAVAATEAPEYGEDWGKKPVSESPWDVAEFKVDTFAQDILVQVQEGKKTRRGPRKGKGASSQPTGEVVAPDELEGLEDIEGSGVDSEHSSDDDLEQKIEVEAERLANLGLNPDKIFEKQFGVAVSSSDINISLEEEIKESDEDVVVEGVEGEEVKKKEKKTRRRKRGKPKKGIKEGNGSKSDLNDSVEIETKSAQKPARFNKPAKVPRVEYRIENVMLHPLAFSFVQRTGRVVNILEFKHSIYSLHFSY
ncbi:uncharacterized protein LOC111697324 [Eurytemora carolleeae]|uniref:uncharacterized protein LOC111697324 n=1 Tax=Eurytemora carolleeae TaxID=1294199 RepID=UPI000C76FAC9|nr:uncharacterized protein LOC111697324 [Eurytemora carolleeae]|eukprot:XP_023323044.1 uncharacterized protein LOC111697324 [Eurytemora affinis]